MHHHASAKLLFFLIQFVRRSLRRMFGSRKVQRLRALLRARDVRLRVNATIDFRRHRSAIAGALIRTSDRADGTTKPAQKFFCGA
jgi:hypothetical protein